MVAINPEWPDNVIEIAGLTRTFGAKAALADVQLSVPRGCVFGLVGVNGAGKTTLIKHVLGLLKAESGSVRVFGRDPARDPAGVLVRVGYLSEEPDLPGWMRVRELIRYTRAFYPSWDPAFAEELRSSFAIDPAARVKHLSKGQRARVGLLLALAHRPELLVLDEPSSGLDPIVRRDILGAIIRTIAEEGRTVLFSSHLLHEVERVADRIALIDRGQVVFSGALELIKQNHHRFTLRVPEPRCEPPRFAGALAWEGHGAEWAAIYAGRLNELNQAAAACGGEVVDQRTPSLDEIFVARVGSKCTEPVKEQP
jgi:ABC-2 type transport system ATP-binding protein